MKTRKTIVEGYTVLIDEGSDKKHLVMTVPELPGVVGQVIKGEDPINEIRHLIVTHVLDLAEKKPGPKKPETRPKIR